MATTSIPQLTSRTQLEDLKKDASHIALVADLCYVNVDPNADVRALLGVRDLAKTLVRAIDALERRIVLLEEGLEARHA